MIQSQKQLAASILVAASLVVSWGVFHPVEASAASAPSVVSITAAKQTGVIQASVRLRTGAATSATVIRYLNKGEQVVILEQTNSYWYKVQTSEGTVGYTSADSQYISVTAAPAAPSAEIVATVRLRETPATSGKVLGYLYKGDKVVILEETNDYWYKVQTAEGQVGYTSSSEQYIDADNAVPTPTATPKPTPTPTPTPTPASVTLEKVIATGMTYLGTPYEFGSSRSDTSTFDCSDFVRQIFIEAAGLKLPADSRQQGMWVRENSTAVTSISSLKRGDLMFFMDYKGSSASAYAGVDRFSERISHVAVYLGNGQILHTYSVASGGVRVDTLSASWMNRFLYGGSVIR